MKTGNWDSFRDPGFSFADEDSRTQSPVSKLVSTSRDGSVSREKREEAKLSSGKGRQCTAAEERRQKARNKVSRRRVISALFLSRETEASDTRKASAGDQEYERRRSSKKRHERRGKKTHLLSSFSLSHFLHYTTL